MNLGNKDVTIAFRCSVELATWLKDHAEISGVSVSDFIRFILESNKWASDMVEKIGDK